MLGRSDSVINSGVPILEKTARKSDIWWVRLVALQALDSLQSMYADREKELSARQVSASNSKNPEQSNSALQLEKAHAQHDKIKALFESIKSSETDKNLLRYYSN